MTLIDERPIAILSAPGSRGDVNPMVAIGSELRRRGFAVVISLAENYAAIAEEAGLIAEPLISRTEFNALVDNPSMWRPVQGMRIILRDASCKFLEPHLNVIKKHHRPGRTVLVAHPLDFASRIHRDIDPLTPMVNVLLSPAAVRNPSDPPRLTSSRLLVRKPASLVKGVYWLADILVADPLLAPTINRVRRSHSLPPVSRILDRWWLSPDLVLGMYPRWFGDNSPPCQGPWLNCGFPLATQCKLAPALGADQEHNRKGFPVFATPGTAHHHAKAFFNNVVEASASIGMNCILATTYPNQLPNRLPSHVSTMAYAALDEVLPQCAAIVHHGGIGTTAIASATACPQLICPMAYDQFHNADRIEALGLGMTCRANPWNQGRSAVQALARQLQFLVGDQATRNECVRRSGEGADFCGSEVAANAISNLLA